MNFNALPCPFTLFSSHTTEELRLVAVGHRLQQILETEEFSFPAFFETKVAYADLEQLAPACKDVHAMVVIADLSTPSDMEIAESVARMSLDAGNLFCFLINIGAPPNTSQSAFSSRISMCNGYRPDLLDSLVDGLIRHQIDPGWCGVDAYDIASALESHDKHALAAIGYGYDTAPGNTAAQAAIDDLMRGGIDITHAAGAAAMIILNGVGLSQSKAVMTLIRQAIDPEAHVVYSCHSGPEQPFTVRVTLIAAPKPAA